LDRGPGGIQAASAAANVAAVYSGLVSRLAELSEPLAPTRKTVALKRVVLTTEGYILQERQSVTAQPTRENNSPGRFAALKTNAGAICDSILLGSGEGWTKARDDQVFEALRDLCENLNASGEVCRQLSINVALAVLVRAGIVLRADQLR